MILYNYRTKYDFGEGVPLAACRTCDGFVGNSVFRFEDFGIDKVESTVGQNDDAFTRLVAVTIKLEYR